MPDEITFVEGISTIVLLLFGIYADILDYRFTIRVDSRRVRTW